MSFLTELDTHLEALKTKVTKSRIQAVTTLCVENVKSEVEIVHKVYGHLQKSQPQQKLGVLYAVDSVIRQWMEKAAAAGQNPAAPAPQDGTFAGGVRRMRELLPLMMTDTIHSAPDDHKEKINKLIEIWERGNVFPSEMIADFKVKMSARMAVAPAVAPVAPVLPAKPAPIAAVSAPAPPTSHVNGTISQSAPAPAPITPQPVVPAPAATTQPAAPNAITPELATALAAIIPAEVRADPAKLQMYVQVLQNLHTMGIPPQQWAPVLQALNTQQAAVAQPLAIRTPVEPIPAESHQNGSVVPQAPVQSAAPAFTQPIPAPAQAADGQRRSRSRSPINRRGSPVYDTYMGGTEYRQRSPLRGDRLSGQEDMIPLVEKWVEMDPSLPANNIKVLSRTLFVGGVACSENELRQIFSRFGDVQSAIVNGEKRHAFVKMCTRAEAVAAVQQMQDIQDPSVTDRVRKTRWGVGFGPRECNNYETGISIIPLDRLTDADRKWAVSAEYGGTGGKPLAAGMVFEEPDIEIGAGVSSKAISARRTMGTDRDRRQYGGSTNNRNRMNTGSRRDDRNYGGNQGSGRAGGRRPQYEMPPSGVSAVNSAPLPPPSTTGFINTNNPGVPAFGGTNPSLMQMMGMMNGMNGMNYNGYQGQQGYR